MGIFEDMAVDILDMDDAVETVYYTANGESEVSFDTHVFRNSPFDPDLRRLIATQSFNFLVYIPVSIVSVVTPQKDYIRILKDRGDTEYTKFKVLRIEKQDAGSYTARIG